MPARSSSKKGAASLVSAAETSAGAAAEIKVFGIKNCDTVKKSLKWLDENHVFRLTLDSILMYY